MFELNNIGQTVEHMLFLCVVENSVRQREAAAPK